VSVEILYFLIPISIVFLGVIIAVFFWAIKSGQYEDMQGPAFDILMDDDDKPTPR
jgi:cbb3-type cytochrome oxidase maturation protein